MHWSVKILAFIYDSGRCAECVAHRSQLSSALTTYISTESAPLDRSETQHRLLRYLDGFRVNVVIVSILTGRLRAD